MFDDDIAWRCLDDALFDDGALGFGEEGERCATLWSLGFGLVWRFWYIYDALALCYLEDLLLVMTLLSWRSLATFGDLVLMP